MNTANQKQCIRCGLFKDLEFFPKNRTSKDGFSCYCRPCNRERCKEWRNRPKVKAELRKKRTTPKAREYSREATRKHRERNRKEMAEFFRSPLGRAKANLYRYRWLRKQDCTPKRLAEIESNIEFYESEVERLTSTVNTHQDTH